MDLFSFISKMTALDCDVRFMPPIGGVGGINLRITHFGPWLSPIAEEKRRHWQLALTAQQMRQPEYVSYVFTKLERDVLAELTGSSE